MQDYRTLYDIFDEMSGTLDELIKIEDRKIASALARDSAGLDEILKEEQAYFMRLRGIDKKRENAQLAAGLAGMTFSRIIESAPETERGRLESYFSSLSRKTAGLREQLAEAGRYIEHNIEMLGSLINRIESDAAGETDPRRRFAEPPHGGSGRTGTVGNNKQKSVDKEV